MPEAGRHFDSLVKATVAAELSAKKVPLGNHMRRILQVVKGSAQYVDSPCPGSGKRPKTTFLEQTGYEPLTILVKGICSASCGKDLTWNPASETWDIS